jgi:hypothetical protein
MQKLTPIAFSGAEILTNSVLRGSDFSQSDERSVLYNGRKVALLVFFLLDLWLVDICGLNST